MHLLKSIIRNFIRKPVINSINLLGLSVSLTLVIILSIYCYSELTTDDFHVNGDEVYLLKKVADGIYLPGILTETIKDKVPGLNSVIRIAGSWEAPVFQANNREPIASDLIFADDDFFNFFTYKPLVGDLNSSLLEPMTIVISEKLAFRLFGKENALGQSILMNNNHSLRVTAVLKDQEKNTCLNFNALTSISTKKIIQANGEEMKEWGWNNFQTFLLLDKAANASDVVDNIIRLIPEDEQKNYKNATLVPLRKLYFSKFSLFGTDHLIEGNKRRIMILLMVAILVLTIALINFINISTSQWQERVKQTGILKILGSGQFEIVRNILAESFMFFLVSLLIAIQLSTSLTPFILRYTGISYNENIISSPYFILSSLAAVLILSIIFSIIPAVKISTSRAIDNLKKTVRTNKTRYSTNGALVTFQFIIAITLIAFTFLIQKQVRFGSNNLGMNQNNIVGFKLTEQLSRNIPVLKEKFEKEPSIKSISFSQYFPGKTLSSWGTRLTLDGENRQVNFDTFCADANFFKMLGLELVSGRFYSDDMTSDRGKILVNEAFLRKNSLTNIDGATIMVGMMGEVASPAEIVGVLKDFHYKSVNNEIQALAIRNTPQYSFCLVHIQANDFEVLKKTVEKVKEITAALSPSFPVEVSFFDKALEDMYNSEVQFRKTFSLMSVSAIAICCFGILALSLFACQRRIKEIGIRKVNGAGIVEILFMLNKDFIRWVLLAFFVSIPIVLFISHKWLKNYAYKTEISWWIFVLAGLSALLIALFTVSWQTWRTATRNPVEALRYE